MTATPLVNSHEQHFPSPQWHLTPGYIEDSGSDVESVHILLGRFLTRVLTLCKKAEKILWQDLCQIKDRVKEAV